MRLFSNNRRIHRSKAFTIGFCCVAALGNFQISAEAATPRQLVQTSLQGLSTHTTQLVQQVQVFLQASGRWSPSPQGQDMQLCQALQSFQQTVTKANNDNGGKPYAVVQTDLQMLQVQSQNVEQLINQRGQSPLVAAAWSQIRNDFANLNQALSMVPGFNPGNFYDSQAGLVQGSNSTFQPGMPGTPFMPMASGSPFVPNGYPNAYRPGMPYPGFRPTNINITENSTFDANPGFQGTLSNYPGYGQAPMMGQPQMMQGVSGAMPMVSEGQSNSQVMSNLHNASDQTERFVKQLTKFLQSKGMWPPPAGTPEMQLCQTMERFQMQIRKLGSDLQTNMSYMILQSEMKDIGATSQSIDQSLLQINASPEINGRWNEVRTSMNNTYQAFFSAGSGNGSVWMR